MKKSTVLGLLLSLSLGACDVILETDLSASKITILAPVDGLTTERLTHTFWWDPVPGATEYQVQVVAPKWGAIEQLVADSILVGNKVELTLEPGTYGWAVRAFNSAYQTAWFEAAFTIDSTGDLSKQIVRLQTPANGDVLNKQEVTFSWDEITIASQYEFQLFTNPQFDTIITSNTLTRSLPAVDGRLSWRVIALNSTSEKRSATQSFQLDFTVPVAPVLQSPADNAKTNEDNITLVWSTTDDDIKDFEVSVFGPDTVTLLAGYPIVTGLNNHVITKANSLADTTYFWTVVATDVASNEGPAPKKRRIIITP